MDFRADLVVNEDNTQPEMMEWFEQKYKAHSGTKRDFVRFLLNELYQKEKNQSSISQKDIEQIKEELKEEVIDYVLKYLDQEGLKEEISKKINDLDDSQVDVQDKLFSQF